MNLSGIGFGQTVETHNGLNILDIFGIRGYIFATAQPIIYPFMPTKISLRFVATDICVCIAKLIHTTSKHNNMQYILDHDGRNHILNLVIKFNIASIRGSTSIDLVHCTNMFLNIHFKISFC